MNSHVRTTCPACGYVVDLSATDLYLSLHEADRCTGDYAYTCPHCARITVQEADRRATRILLSAGVIPLPQERAPDPVFTFDDLIDFHVLLSSDSWFRQLMTLQSNA